VLSVTADTNIYISALNFGGLPRRFLNLAEAGGLFRLTVSDSILAEIGKVLRGKKLRWPEEEIWRVQRQISRFTEHVTPIEILNIITVDPTDNRILECAVAARSDYIVTGDDHLLRLQQYGAIRILKIANFMEILQSQP
jgi:putative PIN family toxin of toxin-antitoxin system